MEHTCIEGGDGPVVEPCLACRGQPTLGERDYMTLEYRLKLLRMADWMVVCHNDYRLNHELMTFWSFSRGNEYVRGEGKTDAEAISEVEYNIQKLTGKVP
jgi:hypothetical protein